MIYYSDTKIYAINFTVWKGDDEEKRILVPLIIALFFHVLAHLLLTTFPLSKLHYHVIIIQL